jgi:hypothetical protein
MLSFVFSTCWLMNHLMMLYEYAAWPILCRLCSVPIPKLHMLVVLAMMDHSSHILGGLPKITIIIVIIIIYIIKTRGIPLIKTLQVLFN